jgi:hypothetical protein
MRSTSPHRIHRHARLLAIVLLLAGPVTGARAAVLLELFTAQGCSSCPPADRLLSAMGRDPDLGKQLVPIAFHVDYWDTKGWRDRFSDHAWTQRQTEYVHRLGGDMIYTPQIVVDGGAQCVGSDVACIKKAVESASAQPHGTVALAFAEQRRDAVEVQVTAQLPAGAHDADVLVGVYESGLDTEVSGGENAHKTLHDDYVVHRLEHAFGVSAGSSRSKSVKVELAPDWRREQVGVVVFLQDPKTHAVMGATAAPLRGAPAASR